MNVRWYLVWSLGCVLCLELFVKSVHSSGVRFKRNEGRKKQAFARKMRQTKKLKEANSGRYYRQNSLIPPVGDKSVYPYMLMLCPLDEEKNDFVAKFMEQSMPNMPTVEPETTESTTTTTESTTTTTTTTTEASTTTTTTTTSTPDTTTEMRTIHLTTKQKSGFRSSIPKLDDSDDAIKTPSAGLMAGLFKSVSINPPSNIIRKVLFPLGINMMQQKLPNILERSANRLQKVGTLIKSLGNLSGTKSLSGFKSINTFFDKSKELTGTECIKMKKPEAVHIFM
ncbi:uncharacterized protein DDB_G0290587-like [Toxorhynchites rutilus septentrionalis]|uniref:uncharacterized protein DDB_G0290587-like n=1 Tax=Toxorhynchites rutilus septentrionalis TaxID=329112 RepID=UPI0024792E4F|nr:uncharacterized protein DDB_G0290587-like [Toxorhynchites rutilus septentrionalis]